MDVVFVGARFVIMASSLDVHEIEFVDDAELLERFQGAINRGQMQTGQVVACPPQDLRRIEVLAGLLKDFGDDTPLAGHAQATRLEFGRDGAARFEVPGKDHSSCE